MSTNNEKGNSIQEHKACIELTVIVTKILRRKNQLILCLRQTGTCIFSVIFEDELTLEISSSYDLFTEHSLNISTARKQRTHILQIKDMDIKKIK